MSEFESQRMRFERSVKAGPVGETPDQLMDRLNSEVARRVADAIEARMADGFPKSEDMSEPSGHFTARMQKDADGTLSLDLTAELDQRGGHGTGYFDVQETLFCLNFVVAKRCTNWPNKPGLPGRWTQLMVPPGCALEADEDGRLWVRGPKRPETEGEAS